MATIATRLTNAGTLLVNGTIDEFTGAPVIDGNVMLWLDAGQTSSYSGTGNTWTDLSSANNTGTLVSSPTFDLIAGGGSLTFNGTSYVSLAANLVPTGSRSITIAFQSSNVSTRVGLIANRDSYGWFCCLNRGGNSNINYDHAGSGGVEGITASNVVTALNTWYISTMTYNVSTGNASIYLNGNLVAGPTTISPIVPVGSNQSFVAREINSGSTLLGKVGDVIVHNRALTASEVLQNYNALAGRYGLAANTNSTTLQRTTSNVVLSSQFDEVTYNSTAPVIKNLLWQTQNWTANIQSSANVSVTANSILAPDGTQTGSTITTTVGGYNNDALIQKWNPTGISTAALPYCLSVYVKQGNCPTIGVNLAFYNGNTYQDAILTLTWSNLSIATTGTNTGTLNYGVIDTGLGWYRLWCSATNNYSAVGVVGRIWVRSVYNNNIVGDYNYAWGMQIEQGSSPTIYQGIGATTLVTPNFAHREDQTGNMYVTNSYDEFTGAPVVDSSLLWWTDGGQTTSYSGSGTTVRNLANTAQSGTIYGNVAYSSVDGGKFVFSDYLDTTNNISAGNVGYPASVNDPWTMEAWIYVPTGATWSINNNVGPLYIRGSYAGAHGLVRMQADNTIAVWLRGNTTALAYRTGVTTRDRWNQVVGVWTGGAGGNLQCYVNGTLTQASTTTQDDPLKSTNFYAIGAANTGLSNNSGAVFVGNISSTKLYNRALTADEVAQNFNALRRRYNI